MQQARVIRFPKTGTPEERRFGAVQRKGRQLYVKFQYLGERQEFNTKLAATAKNELRLRRLLDRVGEALQEGARISLEEIFPEAPEARKKQWAKLEGRGFHRGPSELTFGEYAKTWRSSTLAVDASENKRRDYASVLDHHLLPEFGRSTFDEITGPAITRWIMRLAKAGLSRDRISNVQIPLRVIYRDAVAENHWVLPDPWAYVQHAIRHRKLLPKRRLEKPQPFRFAEWEHVLEAFDPWYRPVAEIMCLTGMIASELAGLRRGDVTAGAVHVRNKISKGVESGDLKTHYRTREVPMTEALRRRLEVLEDRAEGDYLVTLPSGRPFTPVQFWKKWAEALDAAKLERRKPYTLRHQFAIVALLLGLPLVRVAWLMGHGSRDMIDRVYGPYRDGMEEDLGAWREYYGEDFR